MVEAIVQVPEALADNLQDNCSDIVTDNSLAVVSGSIDEPTQSRVEKACISEHKTTLSELNQLKNEIGVYEEGKDYNQLIDGHGTGFRPPTEQEWDTMAGRLTSIDEVTSLVSLPSSVDQSATPWFPPIGNQGHQGSCTAWSIAYYMKTFQEAKEHNWVVANASWQTGSPGYPTQTYQGEIMSPAFLYNLINGGSDSGSWPYDAINLIYNIGICSWEKMPYLQSDYISWPSEDAWTEATLYRGNASVYYFMGLSTDQGVANLKNWIAAGNLASITVDGGQFTHLASGDIWTTDNYYSPDLNHENTIVGYDDNRAYVENGVTHHGAFKVANSWGVGFSGEKVPDGFYWISYNAVKEWVQYCYVYNDMVCYKPEVAASFSLIAARRSDCDIELGLGDPNSSITTKDITGFINGGSQQLSQSQFVFDITEFTNSVASIDNQNFFLKISNHGASAATVYSFSIETATSQDAPCIISSGSTVCLSLVLPPFTTSWSNLGSINFDQDSIDQKVVSATDSDGNIYAAYSDMNAQTCRTALYVRESTDNGQTWQTQTCGYSAYYNILNPSIAIDPYSNDIFVAAELEISPSEHQILVLKHVNSSWSWSAVASASGQDYRFPSSN